MSCWEHCLYPRPLLTGSERSSPVEVEISYRRSQWRKLELALLFIKKSKQSANENTNRASNDDGTRKEISGKRLTKDEEGPEQSQPAKKKIKVEMKIEPRKLSNFSCEDSNSSIRLYSGLRNSSENNQNFCLLIFLMNINGN